MTATHSTIGDYRFVAQIDAGGMGAVYRAVHQTLGHDDTLNPRFAWFLTTITYANGVVGDLRDGIALRGETLWVYNVVIQRGDRNNAQDILDTMAPSLNIYANP